MTSSFQDDILFLQDGLIKASLGHQPLEVLLPEFFLKLINYGIPIQRVVIGCLTLHPVFGSFEITWTHESQKLVRVFFERKDITSEDAKATPFYFMATQKLTRLHSDLKDLNINPNFPLYDNLRRLGFTDYLVFFTPYAITSFIPKLPITGVGVSIATTAPEGFASHHMRALEIFSSTIAFIVKQDSFWTGFSNTLGTYVGERTSQRILSGEVDRGSLESVHAVIWFGDLRGFTRLSDTMSGPVVVECLNAYLECVSRPVLDRGGEILKYMGDGVLGFFELNDQVETRVELALDAATTTFNNLAKLNSERQLEGKPILEFDLVLHIGEVLYGNVGAHKRLDFTVIGNAVNEASRMESLCDSLGCHLLLSDTFTEKITQHRHRLISLGSHQLRGVREPRELFTLPVSPKLEY